METYSETKDPNETKDYSFDWNPKLSVGESISGQTVTLIEANGASVASDSHASGISRVWLTGGIHNGKIIFTIRVSTNGGRTLEEGFAVNVVDSVLEAEPDELGRLKAMLSALQDAQLAAASGRPQEVWNGRYGNKMKFSLMSYSEIKAAISDVNREIADVQRQLAGGSRRTPVMVAWQ